MRRKIGTSLDASLYRAVQEIARREGRSANAVIEDALTRFVSRGGARASVVRETKGTYRVSPKALHAVLNEELYGPD